MKTDARGGVRALPTGSIMSQFGAPQKSRYSDYASLPPELDKMMDQLTKVEFPITSKMDLVKKLGGHEVPLFIGEMAVEAGAAVMFFPASTFPAATPENLAEKLSEYYRQRASVRPDEPITPAETQELASRFAAENAKMIQLSAQLVRWIANEKSQTIDKDSDAFAARLIRENQRLVEEIGDTFASIGTLRAKTSEAIRERQGAG